MLPDRWLVSVSKGVEAKRLPYYLGVFSPHGSREQCRLYGKLASVYDFLSDAYILFHYVEGRMRLTGHYRPEADAELVHRDQAMKRYLAVVEEMIAAPGDVTLRKKALGVLDTGSQQTRKYFKDEIRILKKAIDANKDMVLSFNPLSAYISVSFVGWKTASIAQLHVVHISPELRARLEAAPRQSLVWRG